MAQRVCFRFDVDTHRCLGAASDALAAVAAEFAVSFTFFVHMGRATERVAALGDWRYTATDAAAPSLDPYVKLGRAGVARIVLGNPRIGARRRSAIARLRDAGHEIGLHGGRNHGAWQRHAERWDVARLAEELDWGRAALARAGVPQPAGFASPAWVQPEGLPEIAAAAGFRYLADRHGHDLDAVDTSGVLPDVATTILGEPGGVGYLEWMRALGHDEDVIVADFRRRVLESADPAVVYDHPVWAGRHDLPLVRRLVRVVLDEGLSVVTLREAAGV
ncbi:MAG: polysaccharide deacetylase family protein [Nitriliruptoraceae bacterium]